MRNYIFLARFVFVCAVIFPPLEGSGAILVEQGNKLNELAPECKVDQYAQRGLFDKNSDLANSINILVTWFEGQGQNAEQLGAEVASNLAKRLAGYVHEPQFQSNLDALSILRRIKVRYIPCKITGGHEHARHMGKAMGADLVFWGQAICHKKEDCHLAVINVPSTKVLNTGRITTGSNSPVTIQGPVIAVSGRPEPEQKAAFSTSLTVVRWERLEADQRASVPITLEGQQIQNLDFPRIAAAEPLVLFEFALGAYAFLTGRYKLASDKFTESGKMVSARFVDIGPLYEIIGISHIYARNEKSGISALSNALRSCYAKSEIEAPLCQLKGLIIMGWAHAKAGRCEKALEYYSMAHSVNQQLSHLSSMEPESTQAKILNNIGYAYMCLGNNEKALASLGQAEESLQSRESRDSMIRASILGNIGYLLLKGGRYNESKDVLVNALRIMDRQTNGSDGLFADPALCSAVSLRGWIRDENGVREVGDAKMRDAGGGLPVHMNLTEALVKLGHYVDAQVVLGWALSISLRMGDLEAECSIRRTYERVSKALSTSGDSVYRQVTLPISERRMYSLQYFLDNVKQLSRRCASRPTQIGESQR